MSKPSPTDLELVRGLHARDPKALARVYGDYHAGIYNLCARILGDREEAQDVTQDVFVKAFSKPPVAVEDVRLRPWLFRVATNACLNLIRGRRTGDPRRGRSARGERRPLRAGADRGAHRDLSRRYERALPRGPRAQGPARSRGPRTGGSARGLAARGGRARPPGASLVPARLHPPRRRGRGRAGEPRPGAAAAARAGRAGRAAAAAAHACLRPSRPARARRSAS